MLPVFYRTMFFHWFVSQFWEFLICKINVLSTFWMVNFLLPHWRIFAMFSWGKKMEILVPEYSCIHEAFSVRKPNSSNVLPQRNNFVKSVSKQYGNSDSHPFFKDFCLIRKNTKYSLNLTFGWECNDTSSLNCMPIAFSIIKSYIELVSWLFNIKFW